MTSVGSTLFTRTSLKREQDGITTALVTGTVSVSQVHVDRQVINSSEGAFEPRVFNLNDNRAAPDDVADLREMVGLGEVGDISHIYTRQVALGVSGRSPDLQVTTNTLFSESIPQEPAAPLSNVSLSLE